MKSIILLFRIWLGICSNLLDKIKTPSGYDGVSSYVLMLTLKLIPHQKHLQNVF